MNTNEQTFWHATPTAATRLGGIGRVHGDNLDTGTFSLVFKHLPKQSKPRVMRGPGQVSVAVHKTKREVFNGYQVVFRHHPLADLTKAVYPLVGNLLMQASYLAVCFPLTTAPFCLSGEVTLQAAKFCKVFPQPARLLNQLARWKGCKAFPANVKSNPTTAKGLSCARIWQLKHQAGVPTVIDPFDYGVFDVGLIRDAPVVAHPHSPMF